LVEVFSNYIRAPQRNLVNIVVASAADQKAMKINEVSSPIKNTLIRVQKVPMLVKTGENDEPVNCSNPISIMMEISRVAYLDEILFGKKDSKDRLEIVSFIEMAQRTEADEMVAHLNKHLAMKMFLVGQNITAADIMV
jgi:hypothetical protein